MSATFSPSFVEQRATYFSHASSLRYSRSPSSASSGHTEDHTNSHHQHLGSDSLANRVPFILYPSSMDPASLSLYEGSFRGHSPGLLPYLTPFHHGHFGVYECPFEPAFIQKRNERERQRVKCVNQGYAKLRDHLPGRTGDKRLSKVETLRAAIRYIKYLQSLVEGNGQASHTHRAANHRLEDAGHSGGESPNSSSPGPDCGGESEGFGC
ncbi:achaete-scute homolog 5-like [Centroberyx affinis]|uniref:achaete-scute homolog 5-like n=1 Tax=Centroberyx affinis TaxID=166261 RepID=UPI003A5C0610